MSDAADRKCIHARENGLQSGAGKSGTHTVIVAYSRFNGVEKMYTEQKEFKIFVILALLLIHRVPTEITPKFKSTKIQHNSTEPHIILRYTYALPWATFRAFRGHGGG